jgi:hypothetical protein
MRDVAALLLCARSSSVLWGAPEETVEVRARLSLIAGLPGWRRSLDR